MLLKNNFYLITTKSMTITNTDVFSCFPAHCVETVSRFHILHIPKIVIIQRHRWFRIYIFQIPFKVFAFESFSQRNPLWDIANSNVTSTCNKIRHSWILFFLLEKLLTTFLQVCFCVKCRRNIRVMNEKCVQCLVNWGISSQKISMKIPSKKNFIPEMFSDEKKIDSFLKSWVFLYVLNKCYLNIDKILNFIHFENMLSKRKEKTK